MNSLSIIARVCQTRLATLILILLPSALTPTSSQAQTTTEPALRPFVHPGLLHTKADLERMRKMVASQTQPYLNGWDKLRTDSHASPDYKPRPFAVVNRFLGGRGAGMSEMVQDAEAAYLDAIAWNVTGDEKYATKAVEIMNTWSFRLQEVTGDSDKYLAVGLIGYQFANAAELIRYTYTGWAPQDVERFQTMLLTKFYPLCHRFLIDNDGMHRVDFYYANWDAVNMLGILTIGVFCDDRAKYDEAVHYYKFGGGHGSIMHAITDGDTGQCQESGRDQGHTQLGIGELATLCECAWNQGDDLYGYDDNRLLKGFEYTARYLLGNDVPYTPYKDSYRAASHISPRGNEKRPIYEMVWNHYENRMGVPAPYTKQMAELIRPEGYHRDHPGFGTILFTRPRESAPASTAPFKP